MTKDEKIDKLLRVYCDTISIARGEAYCVAFGNDDNLPSDEQRERYKDSHVLTQAMEHHKLISTDDVYEVFYQATPFGRDIQEKGGWLEHIKNTSKDENIAKRKYELEIANLRLQNDQLSHEIKTREKKEQLDSLTIKSLKQQIRNNRVGFLLLGISLTYLINNWKELLKYFGLNL